jgi:hypothetical protein
MLLLLAYAIPAEALFRSAVLFYANIFRIPNNTYFASQVLEIQEDLHLLNEHYFFLQILFHHLMVGYLLRDL